MEKDPLDQAEEIIAGVQREMLITQIEAHAEVILISAIARKPIVQGMFLFMAGEEGIDYMTGLLVAIGLKARNWGRMLGDDPSLDFTKYINPEAEVFCRVANDGFAHYAVRAVLEVQDTPDADRIRGEIKEFLEKTSNSDQKRMAVHVIGLFAELLIAVLDIRNGDYVPGSES